MNDIFKSDSLLYLAFIMAGMTSIAENFWKKLICIVLSVGIIVLRTFVKDSIKK